MQRRFISSISSSTGNSKTLNQGRWSVKQVKKSNFHVTLDEIRTSNDSSDFIADFTFIHSKFLGPLPSNVADYTGSLSSVFPNVVDLSQFMKEISPLSDISNLPAAMSSLNRFFAPVDVEMANQGDENVTIWSKNRRRVSSENLVFIWGLVKTVTAAKLKNVLQKSHPFFAQKFDVKYLDRSCAIVVFWESGLSETLLSAVNNEEQLGDSLREMVAKGLRAAGYETYKRACRLGFWEADLADSLDKTLESSDTDIGSDTKPSEIDWSTKLAINFDEL